MQKRKIPVFYHIPKNAGTYVSDWFMIAFRHYRRTHTDWLVSYCKEKETIKCLRIIKDKFTIAKFIVGDPSYLCDTNSDLFIACSNSEFNIDLKDLTSELLDNLFLFGIIIEGRGFKLKEELLSPLKKYTLHQFLILRDSFSRTQSLYSYITSVNSKHEFTHGLIKAPTFESYVLSQQLEDSWLIRQLAKLDDPFPLNETHLNKTIDIMKSFNVYSIKETTKAIKDAFIECYNIDTDHIDLKPWDIFTRNETNQSKIKFEEMSPEAQKVFRQRVYLDDKLYKTFIL